MNPASLVFRSASPRSSCANTLSPSKPKSMIHIAVAISSSNDASSTDPFRRRCHTSSSGSRHHFMDMRRFVKSVFPHRSPRSRRRQDGSLACQTLGGIDKAWCKLEPQIAPGFPRAKRSEGQSRVAHSRARDSELANLLLSYRSRLGRLVRF